MLFLGGVHQCTYNHAKAKVSVRHTPITVDMRDTVRPVILLTLILL